jgi:nitroimidazol reductase NimA-like FMN-containing flavoprotein (pyridoxamine 5'-phosphate oxidase superfamily)
MTEAPTARTTVRRLRERGVYERDAIEAILDEALICHLGFVHQGQPFVIPTIHARSGDTVFVHGSPASRMLKTMADGVDVCLTATLLGLVLARSVFHHSMNYRSVVVLGRAREVVDADEKMDALRTVVEHVQPGRWDDARRPNAEEFRKTRVLALGLDEASAKVRSGPAGDEEEDMDLPVWAGVVPLELVARAPVPDDLMPPAVPLPGYLADRTRA